MRATEKGRWRKKTTAEEERKQTVGGKVAEMFVGIPGPVSPRALLIGDDLKMARALIWRRP